MSLLSRSGVMGSALLATALPFALPAAEKTAAIPPRYSVPLDGSLIGRAVQARQPENDRKDHRDRDNTQQPAQRGR